MAEHSIYERACRLILSLPDGSRISKPELKKMIVINYASGKTYVQRYIDVMEQTELIKDDGNDWIISHQVDKRIKKELL